MFWDILPSHISLVGLIWGTLSSTALPAIASDHFRFNFEIIFSQRKVKRERLSPTKRTTNAPVKFFKLRRETLLLGLVFLLLSLWGFPLHCGGMGRNQVSQWSISPICINSSILVLNLPSF